MRQQILDAMKREQETFLQRLQWNAHKQMMETRVFMSFFWVMNCGNYQPYVGPL